LTPIVFTAESIHRLEARLSENISDNGFPNLAIVFSSVIHDMESVRRVFKSFNIAVFGASTAGEIAGMEVYEETITVMLLRLPENSFSLSVFDGAGLSSLDLGKKAGSWAREFHENPSVLLMASGHHTQGEQIVKGFLQTAGDQANLYGCMAAHDPAIIRDDPQTFVFSDTRVSPHGVIVLALNPDMVSVNGIAAGGWKGIGTPKTISKATGNTVYTIDNIPALDVVNRYLRIGDDPEMAAEYPLLWEKDDGTWAMRTIIGIHPDKSIVLSGSFPENAKVRFGMSPGTDIIAHTMERLSAFKKETKEGDALILFSCRARLLSLGPMIKEEIKAVQNIWQLPMAGFFTNGEFGPKQNRCCSFYNQTLVSVLLSWEKGT